MELWSPGTLFETKSENKDLQTIKKGNAAEMSKKKKKKQSASRTVASRINLAYLLMSPDDKTKLQVYFLGVCRQSKVAASACEEQRAALAARDQPPHAVSLLSHHMKSRNSK
jgi:hypothetical protein